jgi:hypothetical protein
MADRYSMYPAQFTYAGPTTLNVQEMHGFSIKPNAKKDEVYLGGNVDPSAFILQSAEPVANIKTHDVKTVLTAVSLTAGLATIATSTIQSQKRADGGVFAGGSTNTIYTNKKGFLLPKRLTASVDRPAELELEFWGLWDGSTTGSPALPIPPFVIATLQALVTSPAFNDEWFLGPVYANGVQIPGIKEFNVDFGLEYKTLIADGDLYPQVGSIVKRRPKKDTKTTDAAQAGTVGSFFNAATPGTLAFYLRHGVAGAARSSDASTVHIKISAAAGAWDVSDVSGDGSDDVMTSINIDPTGTLAINMASAIP